VCPLVVIAIKKGIKLRPNYFSRCLHFFSYFLAISAFGLELNPSLKQIFFLAMAASHPHQFHPSLADSNEICKLDANHFHPDHAVLQWHPATGEYKPRPNTNEIVVFPPSSNAVSVSHPAISSVDFLITTRSN
jgi:hypothetical protein